MAFSYTFHLSAKSHAVTNTNKVAQISRHNLRGYKGEGYDRSQIEILRGNQYSILDEIKNIYHREFDEVLEHYNEGKRSDRQITDYLDHVSTSKNDVAVEIIIQVGDTDFWAGKTDAERRQMTHIFKDQIRALEKLIPELKVASAVVHYDENSPHMHVVGVPVATGYKRGLERQVGKTKVFTPDKLSYLQDKMRENAERGMEMKQNRNLFGKVKLQEKKRGRNKDIPKESMDEYTRLQMQTVRTRAVNRELAKETERLNREADRAFGRLASAEAEVQKLDDDISTKKELAEQYGEHLMDMQMEYRERAEDLAEVKERLEDAIGMSEVVESVGAIVQEEEVGGPFRKHTVVTVEGLSAGETESLIRAGAGLEGAMERAEKMLQEARDEAKRIRTEAEVEVQRARSVLRDKDQIIKRAQTEADKIKAGAERERSGLLSRAREKAEEIIGDARQQLKDIKSNIKSLLNQQERLSRTVEGMIDEAHIEAERIIQDAHRRSGKGRQRQELQEMLGLVPRAEVARAHTRLMETWEYFLHHPKTTPNEMDYEAFRELDVGYFEREARRNKVHGLHGTIAKDMRSYVQLKNEPHTIEEVKHMIDKSIEDQEHFRSH